MVEKRQVVASKTVVLLFSTNVKSSKFPKKWFWRHIEMFANLFKGLAGFSIHKRALSTFSKMQQKF